MIKKLLFAGALTASLAVLALVAEPVSADYYDCYGNIKSGDPAPSECHYYITPQRSATSDRDRAGIVTDSGSTSSTSDRDRANIVTPTGSGTSSSYSPSTDRTRADIVTEIGRNYSDLEDARNRADAVILNDSEDEMDYYSKPYEVRNARKYCIRDYCYIMYDYCYDLTHCEQKVQKMPRDNYDDGKNWRDMFDNYLKDHYHRDRERNCNQYGRYPGRCVYRGFHFGGFQNGYWYY